MKLALVAALLVLSSAAAPARADGLDPQVRRLLDDPQRMFAELPRGFRIIALSNVAEYCTSAGLEGELEVDEARACVSRTVELATGKHVSMVGGDPRTAPLGSNGLYLSHLNIVLGAYQRTAGDGKHRALNERISRHLAAGSLRAKHKHFASYEHARQRWPADQAATLYSLHLFDRNFGTTLAEKPTRAWMEWVDDHALDETTQLPRSEITGTTATSKYPRGCALSFTVRYLSAFAPEEARALWGRYKDHYEVGYGPVYGFREWPPGVDRRGDLDSGPIVAGIGTAASGLAIGAARAVGDDTTYARLKVSAAIAAAASQELAGTSGGILARAIELASTHLRPWY